jgi:hypothetical protein
VFVYDQEKALPEAAIGGAHGWRNYRTITL